MQPYALASDHFIDPPADDGGRQIDVRAGNLSVILARTPDELEGAQRLRYRVFYEELGAIPTSEVLRLRRDFDEFDMFCDHLLVVDESLPDCNARVVGTYRLLRRESMQPLGAFYSEREFDISAIKQFESPILELGRSCVHEGYRNRAVMQLLWRGIAAYIALHGIRMMFGCASLPGTDPQAHAEALSYLYHYHLAPQELRPVALPQHYVTMDRVRKEQLNAKRVFTQLPALLKGYLRLGAWVGDGAVVDHQCNTTDVAVILKTDIIAEQYLRRYAADGLGEDK